MAEVQDDIASVEKENESIIFEPIVSLPQIETKTLEEDEEILFQQRGKLYRYIQGDHDDGQEWKDRGVGEVKLLRHRITQRVRFLMRREKTRKLCANHFIVKGMGLARSAGSDKAWVWSVNADYADEKPKPETLAIRFKDSGIADRFRVVFEQSVIDSGKVVERGDGSEEIVSKIQELSVGRGENGVVSGEKGEPNGAVEEVEAKGEVSAETKCSDREIDTDGTESGTVVADTSTADTVESDTKAKIIDDNGREY